MGNTASAPQAQRASRPSNPGSPRVRSTPLVGEPVDAKGRRRKKSIELSDVVEPSLSFTHAHATGKSTRAHKTQRGTDIIAPEEEADDGALSGTLRGAMQGKAEHVVYGPRREDPAPSTTPNSLAARPRTIALPSPVLTHAPLIDPDDTVHPGFKASPRLTSAVLLSQDRMPVLVSPVTEGAPAGSPFATQPTTPSGLSHPAVTTPTTSLAGAVDSLFHTAPISSNHLLPPHTSPPFASTSVAPVETVLAPPVPVDSLPISEADIPSGTAVLGSPVASPAPGATPTGVVPSPAVLLPPRLFNAPVAAIPIPLLSVPSATIAASLLAAAVDLGAGADGVPTLIKWKDEDGQTRASGGRPATGPKEVFVTGTFAKGWKTKIELRQTDPSDFSALISLPPGPHRLKFIVDREWKASKHLPVATDADGNLINYLQVNATDSKVAAGFWTNTSGPVTPAGDPRAAATPAPPIWPGFEDEDDLTANDLDDEDWTQEIPPELVEWGEWEIERDNALDAAAAANENGEGAASPKIPPAPASSGVPPPSLPAQLEKGPLNHAAYVTQGSGDDNSILPKPDHSVINHLAASPIKGGFLSVGVTTRYKRKFVTVVYYKALAARG